MRGLYPLTAVPKKPAWKPDRRKPSKSGSDTPRSTDVVSHGGKVDPDALLRRIQQAQAREETPATSSAPEPASAPAEETDEAGTPRIIDDPDRIAVASTSEADDDAPNRVVFVLQKDLDKRLDKYLCDRITFMSRTQLQRLIEEGGVTVNGRTPKSSTKLRANDTVEVYVPPPPPTEIQPEDIPLEVLFEDDHLVVINKRPDIIVHPARSHNTGTMINALAYHFKHRSGGALSAVGKDFARPGVVHRLDRNTSGLIIFAKSDEAHWRIGRQFEQRTVDKRYLAIVHGLFEPDIDTIELPIGPHPSRERGKREQYVIRHDYLGKHALTIARVRRRFASGFSLVELELKTGRTHQIRVHLTHRGFPILGDDMYGGKTLFRAASPADGATLNDKRAARDAIGKPLVLINRQALHATTLSFRHPADNRVLSFAAPLPKDMRDTLAALAAMDPEANEQRPGGATIDLGCVL